MSDCFTNDPMNGPMNGPKSCTVLSCCVYHWSFIYLIVNIINLKKYVGQTVQRYRERMKHHRNMDDNCVILNHAIAKYGWNKFRHSVVFQCYTYDQNQLDELERYFIKSYNCFGRNTGYNCTSGGHSGGKRSREYCEAQSKRLKTLYAEGKIKGPPLNKCWKYPIEFANKVKKDFNEGMSKSSIARKYSETYFKNIALGGARRSVYALLKSDYGL